MDKNIKGKTIGNTKLNTKNDYFQLRMEREWKDKVKMISEMNNTTFSNFIRQSVDKNIQSMTG
jgi:predicted DNA-binding protein|tara:strand:+ start:200 stop:388 length:189 start_codon:yes stop_codon:yes gene_type:complete